MNSPLVVFLWILNVVVDNAGHVAFKVAAMEPGQETAAIRWWGMACRPWLWLGIVCFIAEFVLWMAFLSLIPLAEGVLLGMIGIAATMLCGRIFFHEHFTPMRVIGISLIVVGVALVGVP
jgi:drug/metabolite transporter (DMT)-like permease